MGSQRVRHDLVTETTIKLNGKSRENCLKRNFTLFNVYIVLKKKKSRDITLPTKVHLVKAMVFPVVMYGYKSWTIKKAEYRRTDAFELWCWRRLLRVPWTARRSNLSILKEISPVCSLEDWCWSWNSNTSATWCKELIHWKDHDAGKDWRQEKRMTEDEMVGCITNSMDMSLNSPGSWWWTGNSGVLQSMGLQRVGHD